MQTLGAAVFVALGQTVFTNELLKNIQALNVPVDPLRVLSGGTTSIATLIDPEHLNLLRTAYNASITEVCRLTLFLPRPALKFHCTRIQADIFVPDIQLVCGCWRHQLPWGDLHPLVERQEEKVAGRRGSREAQWRAKELPHRS